MNRDALEERIRSNEDLRDSKHVQSKSMYEPYGVILCRKRERVKYTNGT